MDNILLFILNDLKPLALRYCNYNTHDAEDLLSDLSLKWVEVSHKYNHLPLPDIKRILGRSLRNLFLDSKRRAKVQPFVVTDNVGDHADETIHDEESIALYNKIIHFLERQSDKKYKALLLYNKGWKVKDIAKLHNTNTSTTSGQIRYARKDIKRLFREGKPLKKKGRQIVIDMQRKEKTYTTEKQARKFLIQLGIIKQRKRAA